MLNVKRDDDDDGITALNPVEIAEDIISSILDEMFPAEKAASEVISELLDKVATSVKRKGLCGSLPVCSLTA